MRGVTRVVHIVLFAAALTRGDQPPTGVQLPAGFQPHVQTAPSGQVDWTAGFILAGGRGVATGTDNVAMLKARRAAELDAAANALAIAAGLNLDAGHRTGGMREGSVRIEGMLKGHQVTDEKWSPGTSPPEYRVTLRVPLWGAQSVANVFRAEHVESRKAPDVKRMDLATEEEELAGVLIFDARGTGFDTCLFPSVACIEGVTVYDVVTATKRPADKPPIRYAETKLPFDQLHALADETGELPWLPIRRAYLAAYGPNDPTPTPAATASPVPPLPATPAGTNGEAAATSNGVAITSNGAASASPAPQTRRKRTAVKAIKAEGDMHGQLVLTREDAERLQKDPQAAAMLRNAEIIIVVDSVAAGVQGRRPERGAVGELAARGAP